MKVKRGVSLIVLVITIIVIIILAGAVILNLGQSDLILNAKEATFKSSVSGYNSELSLAISNQYSQDPTLNINEFNATVWDGSSNIDGTVKQYIPSLIEADKSSYIIEKGKLIYVGEDTNKIKWVQDIGVKPSVVKDGLVLWLDGSDFINNSSNTTWVDRSGNGNNATATNFNYDSYSGSDNKGGVIFDGVNDTVLHDLITIPSMTNWTINFNASYRQAAIGKWFDIFGYSGSHTIMFHSIVGFSWYTNYELNKTYIAHVGLIIGNNIEINTPVNLSIKCEYIDTIHADVSFYLNGKLFSKKLNYLLNPSYNGFKTRYVGTSDVSRAAPWTLYSYQLYNRALTDVEILQNYNACL